MSVDQRTRAKAVAANALTRADWSRIEAAVAAYAASAVLSGSRKHERQWTKTLRAVQAIVALQGQAEASLKVAAQRALDNVVADLERNKPELEATLDRLRKPRPKLRRCDTSCARCGQALEYRCRGDRPRMECVACGCGRYAKPVEIIAAGTRAANDYLASPEGKATAKRFDAYRDGKKRR